MDEKEKNYNFIKKFSKIKVTTICKKLKCNRQNILTNTAKADKLKEVKEEIESEYAKLYIKDD